MSNTKRNLKFLRRRHEQTGFDIDYLEKLSEPELQYLEKFARAFYDGDGCTSPEEKKAANRRRYLAKQADAMLKSEPLSPGFERIDSLNAESLLIMLEDCKK